MTSVRVHESLIIADENERANLSRLRELFDHAGANAIRLVGPEGEEYSIPVSVFLAFMSLIRVLDRGNGAEISSLPSKLSLAEAGDLLDVPESGVVDLIEQGDLSATENFDSLTIPLAELIRYKMDRDEDRDRLLSELTRLSQEYGLYE
ncbi:MAG: hypothetical protein ACOC9Y_07780 [Chloroflexota bacterium]